MSERLLIVGPSWIGDAVMAHSLVRFLRSEQPSLVIDMLIPAWAAPIATRMPEIEKVLTMPFKHGELQLRRRYRLGCSLRGRYTRAIVLPLSLKIALIPYWARIRIRTGFAAELRTPLLTDARAPNTARIQTMAARYLTLALPNGTYWEHDRAVPRPRLSIDADNAATIARRIGIDDAPIAVLAPGAAYGPAKRWQPHAFAALSDLLTKDGYRVFLCGGRSDAAIAEIVRAKTALRMPDNLCGTFSVTDSLDFLSSAHLVVANDSGVMHMAAAVGVPVIGIYGASTPRHTPPLTKQAVCITAPTAPTCWPCFAKTCKYGHYRCLTDISPAAVHRAAHALLRSSAD